MKPFLVLIAVAWAALAQAQTVDYPQTPTVDFIDRYVVPNDLICIAKYVGDTTETRSLLVNCHRDDTRNPDQYHVYTFQVQNVLAGTTADTIIHVADMVPWEQFDMHLFAPGAQVLVWASYNCLDNLQLWGAFGLYRDGQVVGSKQRAGDFWISGQGNMSAGQFTLSGLQTALQDRAYQQATGSFVGAQAVALVCVTNVDLGQPDRIVFTVQLQRWQVNSAPVAPTSLEFPRLFGNLPREVRAGDTLLVPIPESNTSTAVFIDACYRGMQVRRGQFVPALSSPLAQLNRVLKQTPLGLRVTPIITMQK